MNCSKYNVQQVITAVNGFVLFIKIHFNSLSFTNLLVVGHWHTETARCDRPWLRL